MNILGVKVDNLSKKEILEKIDDFLSGDAFRQIATVNPEFILQAQKNEEFKSVLNKCDLNVADGIGIRFAFWRFRKKLRARIAGIDLMWSILRVADKKRLKIFLVANKSGLSSWREARGEILKTYADLKISGIDLNYKKEDEFKIQDSNDCDVLFVNFGAPEQEKFINDLKNSNTNIRLAMGVGGSFDFISGKIKRAPKLIRKFGFEWLWRLILQPRRIKRIWNAVVIFPIRIVLNKYESE